MDAENGGLEWYAMDPIWKLQAIKWYCVEIYQVNRDSKLSLFERLNKTDLCPIMRSP